GTSAQRPADAESPSHPSLPGVYSSPLTRLGSLRLIWPCVRHRALDVVQLLHVSAMCLERTCHLAERGQQRHHQQRDGGLHRGEGAQARLPAPDVRGDSGRGAGHSNSVFASSSGAASSFDWMTGQTSSKGSSRVRQLRRT
ncbi:MAG: hypothetical protein ACK56I_00265, partial [bacterium]